MAKWKEGDRVKVVARPVTEDDRKTNRYYEHMAGLVGTVQYLYAENLVSVMIDPAALPKVSADVHKEATSRMRQKFVGSVGEEVKKTLSPEELNFGVNFSVLVDSKDLEKAS